MPAPATADEFLDLVQRSGVTDEVRLKNHLAQLAARSGVPTDPSKLAGVLVRDGLLTYFQADQLLQGKWKRFFIGKYRVLERIGVGGMGHVFLCEHKLMRRRVAVKVLPAAKAADPSSLERFYREARAVAALDHPNIVHAYDVDQDDNLHFLVMEYVDGTNLQDLVKKFGPLDVTRACHYVYAAAVGLQHAFELGLVHRDIKPANILVDRSGVVKVLDMGLARFFNDDEDALTKKYDENILGTADYLAPEQAIDSHTVDIRADVYGLGGTFFYLLTGQPPFPEGTVAQKLLWHQTREPVALRTLRPEVPAELAAVVAKMMAKELADRYQTPAEVMAALADWVQAPIAPPDEKEMPQLSPAAMSAAVGQTGPRGFSGPPTVVSGPTTVAASDVAESASTPTPGPGGATDVGPAPKPAVPVRPPGADRPPVAATLAAPGQSRGGPPSATAEGVWEELTAETSPGSKVDTDRTRRSTPRHDPSPEPRRNRRRVALFAAGGVLALGLLAAAAVATYLLFFKKPTPPPVVPGTEPKTWYVSSQSGPDPDHTVRSIVDALQRAGTGDTVRIMDERIEVEAPVRVSSKAGVKKRVRVEAGTPSKKVVWVPRSPVRDHGLLEVSDIEDFSLVGCDFDLGGRVDHGVVVSRSCPGLTLENVSVQRPSVSGFRFAPAAGEADRPIRLNECRVDARDRRLAAAVELTDGTRNVVFENGRLVGPGSAAVKLVGAAQAVIRNNRIYKFDYGLSLTGDMPNPAAIDLTVSGNTFHSITTGVDVQPLSAGLTRLALTRNYFVQTKAIASSAAEVVVGFQAGENARDGASGEGNLNSRSAGINFKLPPTNPANDATFLRPPAGKPGPATPDGVQVGAR